MICLRNNWKRGIYNGLTGTVLTAGGMGARLSITIQFDDGSLYDGVAFAAQFNYPATLMDTSADLFDYGYCLTAHKSQGSQARSVAVFEEHPRFLKNDEWKRWLYTAVTRAEEKLCVIPDGLRVSLALE